MNYLDQLHQNAVDQGLDPFEEDERLCIRVEQLERLIIAADRAVGTHNAPDDCFATGPMTGDPIIDLVECPACIYLAMRKKVAITQPKR